jgi:hypothetical protein
MATEPVPRFSPSGQPGWSEVTQPVPFHPDATQRVPMTRGQGGRGQLRPKPEKAKAKTQMQNRATGEWEDVAELTPEGQLPAPKPKKKAVAYDYENQKWVKGEVASAELRKQAMQDLKVIDDPKYQQMMGMTPEHAAEVKARLQAEVVRKPKPAAKPRAKKKSKED